MTPMQWKFIEMIDQWLDDNVSQEYKDQPLAQDWARIAKESEEKGESIAELILLSGQNPRKGKHPEAREQLLMELADRVFTGMFAIQHFTKNIEETRDILDRKLNLIFSRIYS